MATQNALPCGCFVFDFSRERAGSLEISRKALVCCSSIAGKFCNVQLDNKVSSTFCGKLRYNAVTDVDSRI